MGYQFVVSPPICTEQDRNKAFRAFIGSLVKRPTDSPLVEIPKDPRLSGIMVVYCCRPAAIGDTAVSDVTGRAAQDSPHS